MVRLVTPCVRNARAWLNVPISTSDQTTV